MYSITKNITLFAYGLVLLAGYVLNVPANTFADPSSTTIKCQDGTTVTVQRTGTAFTTKDYQKACAKHKGYKAPTVAKCDPTSEACATSVGNGGGSCNSLSHCDLTTKYINPLIKFLAALVGIAVVASIVVGGIQYASSADDPQKVSAAKNRIRNAILALVTFIFLYALLNFLIPGGLT